MVSNDDSNNSVWLYEQTGSGYCTFELLMMDFESFCGVILFNA